MYSLNCSFFDAWLSLPFCILEPWLFYGAFLLVHCVTLSVVTAALLTCRRWVFKTLAQTDEEYLFTWIPAAKVFIMFTCLYLFICLPVWACSKIWILCCFQIVNTWNPTASWSLMFIFEGVAENIDVLLLFLIFFGWFSHISLAFGFVFWRNALFSGGSRYFKPPKVENVYLSPPSGRKRKCNKSEANKNDFSFVLLTLDHNGHFN